MKEVRISGELSYYLADKATGTVKQIKTNRMTGRKITTDITGTKKAALVLKAAA